MSSYSEGQIHQLAEGLQAAGFTAYDVTNLGQNALRHLGLVRGTHRIVETESIVVQYTGPLAEFFTTRSGLHVLQEFKYRILAPAIAINEYTVAMPATVGKPFDLAEGMNDIELRKQLGGNHVFENAAAFCLYLKTALSRRSDETTGDFSYKESGNFFYVRGLNRQVFLVEVNRYAVSSWCIYAHRPDTRLLCRGSRIFPCLSSQTSNS